MKKVMLLRIGILLTLTTISFLVYPSLFTGGKSMWREYTDFDDISNFDTEIYDLYRRVSINSVYLEDDNPFITLEGTKVTYYLYYGSSRTSANMWPHIYPYDNIDKYLSHFNFFCITAVEDNNVIAKYCTETSFELVDYEELVDYKVVSSSAIELVLQDGVITYSFSVVHIDDIFDKGGTSEEFIHHMKKRFKNDKDYMILVDSNYEANE
ncbi:hypothetical protein RJG79_09145 [Mycoplasmatota bacterium WC44]